MKHPKSAIAAISLLFLTSASAFAIPQSKIQFRHIPPAENMVVESIEQTVSSPSVDSSLFRVREVDEILSSLGTPDFNPVLINKVFGPWVFLGYRDVTRRPFSIDIKNLMSGFKVMTNDSSIPMNDKIFPDRIIEVYPVDSLSFAETLREDIQLKPEPDYSMLTGDPTPKWLRDALTSYQIQEDFMYDMMVTHPETIEYSYWDLPVPPRLLDDDVTFSGFIKRLNLPDVDPEKAILPDEELRKKHWLHNIGAALQFSQAYVSKNWYQGGNNHLALLMNFYWNFQLNQVYHPDVLLQSALSYKLALNSTPQDEVHAYSISEDVLQYNLNTGLKAFKKWFYSFNMQFKTQILRNYEQNSMVRKASFLSPGDFNLGLGMAYSHQNQKKTVQFTATLSPISYNLKTCITDKIDHEQFNISPSHHSRSEIGSNGEFNMTWQITPDINYRTRVFLFTDYDYFLSDWENTLSFTINKFLSTQIYVHMRYDTSTDMSTSWKHFMLREILSFGLSYTFSTKP